MMKGFWELIRYMGVKITAQDYIYGLDTTADSKHRYPFLDSFLNQVDFKAVTILIDVLYLGMSFTRK